MNRKAGEHNPAKTERVIVTRWPAGRQRTDSPSCGRGTDTRTAAEPKPAKNTAASESNCWRINHPSKQKKAGSSIFYGEGLTFKLTGLRPLHNLVQN